MQILWIKRMSFGVVIINLVMVCGYLFLTILVLFAPTSFRNRAEVNKAPPSFWSKFIYPFVISESD